MNIAYLLATEEANYTHEHIDGYYMTLDEGMVAFRDMVKDCLDSVEKGCGTTDYISLEKIEAQLDENGEVEDVLDNFEIVAEHVINEEQ